MTGFTPGPWTVWESESDDRPIYVASCVYPDGRVVSIDDDNADDDWEIHDICTLDFDGDDYETILATANLIAAAPSLLEALERVMEHARNPRGGVCLLCGWAVGHDHNAPCGEAIELIMVARGEVVPGA